MFSIGFGRELFGFNDRHGTRWKLSAIPLGGYVKFFGDENAASVPDQAALERMTTRRSARQSFFHKPVGPPRGHRRRRPDREFHFGDRDFRGDLHAVRQADHDRAGRYRAARYAAAAAGFQPGDIVVVDRRPPDRKFLRHAAHRQRQRRPHARLQVERGGTPITSRRRPTLRARSRTRFGNNYCHRVLGISRSMTPADVKVEPVDPTDRDLAGAKETWFVVDRTFSYIGGLFAGRESADQLGGPIRIAQVSGQVADARLRAASATWPPCCRSRSGC